MKWKNQTLNILFVFVVAYMILGSGFIVYSRTLTVYGRTQLYLAQNDKIGVASGNGFVEAEVLTATPLNVSCFIQDSNGNGYLSFISNTNCSIRLLTDINTKYQVNDFMSNSISININTDFSFLNGDTVKIIWRVSNPYINFYIGLVGVALFCLNPLISYFLSDKMRNKFKFFFLLMGIGIISVGLSLTFVYGG